MLMLAGQLRDSRLERHCRMVLQVGYRLTWSTQVQSLHTPGCVLRQQQHAARLARRIACC